MVQRTLIRPPASRLGPITPQERAKLIAESPVAGQYDKTVDRESAFEMLQKKAADAQSAEQQATERDDSSRKPAARAGRCPISAAAASRSPIRPR